MKKETTVKELIALLQEQDPDAVVAIGSTDSCWSTLGCTVYAAEWWPDKIICGREYGNTNAAGQTPIPGKSVVELIP
jgi:hypothetical protein